MSTIHIGKVIKGLRIQKDMSSQDFLVDNKGAEIQKLLNDLDSCLVRGNIERADTIIAELENNEAFMRDRLNKQYMATAKAAIAASAEKDPAMVICALRDALGAEIKNFSEDEIGDYILTKIDSTIINMIALRYFELEDYERAAAIYFGLKKNVEKNCIDKIEKGQRYPVVIFNLTSCLYAEKRYEEAIELCIIGREACLDTGYLRRLPNIALNQACSLLKLGKRDASEELLRQVYYTFCLHG